MEKVKILKCKIYDIEKIKNLLGITLNNKISSARELNNIITIILEGLFVEDYEILSRYKLCTQIEVFADRKNNKNAIIDD
jgi:hypothetical protein